MHKRKKTMNNHFLQAEQERYMKTPIAEFRGSRPALRIRRQAFEKNLHQFLGNIKALKIETPWGSSQ